MDNTFSEFRFKVKGWEGFRWWDDRSDVQYLTYSTLREAKKGFVSFQQQDEKMS